MTMLTAFCARQGRTDPSAGPTTLRDAWNVDAVPAASCMNLAQTKAARRRLEFRLGFAEQDKTRQDKTRQDKARQGKALNSVPPIPGVAEMLRCTPA